MKKLFNITEEERNRILNLHDLVKNLTEQSASIDNTRVSRPIQKMDTSEEFKGFGGGSSGGGGATGTWDDPTPTKKPNTTVPTVQPVPPVPPIPSQPPTQGGLNGQMQPARILADTVNSNKFIYQGMNGEVVKYLQTLLGIPNGDGKFGPQTKQSLIAFQKKNHLTPDGVVGKKTGSLLMQFSNERGTKAFNSNKITPIQPQKTIPPTQPTQPTQTQPTQPTQTQPTQPTQPTQTQPTQPTQPTQTQPTQPTQTQPTQPTWNSKYGNKNVNKFK